MFRKSINKIKRQFQNNYIVYFILTSFLIIGIILGSFIVVKYREDKVLKAVSYFNWIFKYLDYELYSCVDICKFSFFSNMKIILFTWVMGLLGLGVFIIPIVILSQGISIGFTVAFLVNAFKIKGFLFSFFGLLPYYLLFIPTILSIASLCIFNAIPNNNFKKGKILKSRQFIDYIVILLFSMILIFLISTIEGFISFNLIKIIKIAF